MPHGVHSGRVIKMARKAQGLTLREVAAMAEVDYSMLSKVERGEVDPSARWLKAVTEALGRHASLGGAA